MICEEKSVGINTKKTSAKNNPGKPIMFDFHKKNFSLQNNLNKHFKSHNTENYAKKCFFKPFFYSKGLSKNLKMHFLYECTFCRKLFAHNSNLSRHMRVHSDEKLFQCNLCEKSFTSSSNLGTHLGNHVGSSHTMKNPFKCGYCKKIFKISNELIKHIELHRIRISNKSSCSLKAAPLSVKSCLATKHMVEQSLPIKNSFDLQYKPDHTYCSSASQLPDEGNQSNLEASTNRTNQNMSNPAVNNQLKPDHTYWSHTKKFHFCKRKVKSSHSSQKSSRIQLDSNKHNTDHTYSSDCSSNLTELHTKPLSCDNEPLTDKNQTMKPDHTYSIGDHCSHKKSNSQNDSGLKHSCQPSRAASQCSIVEKSIPLNNQISKQVNVLLKNVSKNNCLSQNVDTTTHCSNGSKPDHTYSHKKVISNWNTLETFGNMSAKADWEKLSFNLQATKENQPSVDHTYCFDAKLQKESDGKDTDHTYCLDDNFICSHNLNTNMMLDHTYCLMHVVTRNF
ncbi:zinc finger protein 429-like [Argonauta hians]